VLFSFINFQSWFMMSPPPLSENPVYVTDHSSLPSMEKLSKAATKNS